MKNDPTMTERAGEINKHLEAGNLQILFFSYIYDISYNKQIFFKIKCSKCFVMNTYKVSYMYMRGLCGAPALNTGN